MNEGTVFDEINAVKQLVDDNRKTLYSLEEMYDQDAKFIQNKRITIKSLELYLASLESTVSARARQDSRENSLL